MFCIGFPACLQLVVVNSDERDNRANSSNFGRTETDLAAPGDELRNEH
jgi:hypothetical protein